MKYDWQEVYFFIEKENWNIDLKLFEELLLEMRKITSEGENNNTNNNNIKLNKKHL